MISIQSSMTELERSHQVRQTVLECYSAAVNNVAHYAMELDPEVTRQYRRHLSALAAEVLSGDEGSLTNSRATLRGLLRDFRDRSSAYVANLRDELAGTARALEEILDSLNQSDGDHEARLRTALASLRTVAAAEQARGLSEAMTKAADSIEQSVEEMRKQHQLSVTQFMTEIRMLHKRIDTLEAAASMDHLTRLANRGEMTERIRLSSGGEYCLLLLNTRGLLRAEVEFGKEVGEELAAAFAKRLRNGLKQDSEGSRWGAEEFVIKVALKKPEAMALGRWINENLSGQYVCLKAGKAVRPTLQVSVGVVDTSAGEQADHVLRRIDLFFGDRH
ncbi:MAG TPA: diguanylate cyclase [Candidatus Acidoferrales bacterium]|nr:diguanylate cyclase [Candidatus Acidoferrales bacterium]